MIAKHVPMRNSGLSSFADLVAYVSASQGKEHRVGEVRVTNCESATLSAAVEEVLATQHMNKRAKGDKTFHLILSFREGETLGADVLKEIEARVCAGLGYAEHQRVSAVHHDTDNLHIHIAINKIHPKRRTMHEPYYSHRTLAGLCAAMEKDYGLQVDNHMTRQRGGAALATDMERHAGVESLVGWIKQEDVLSKVRAASSWEQVHSVLAAHGLTIQARGAGFVLKARDGTTVKASTVARDLSKGALEKRLGDFEEGSGSGAVPDGMGKAYERRPCRTRVDTSELYETYRHERERLRLAQRDGLAAARQRKKDAVEAAKRANRRRRLMIKHMSRGVEKRILYAFASRAMKRKLEQIHADYAREREEIYRSSQRKTWADWLVQRASKGDGEALEVLRARRRRDEGRGIQNDVRGEGERGGRVGASVVDGVTKKGTVLFRANGASVRDDGERLAVEGRASDETLKVALQLTAQRYGARITVGGTEEFKEAVLRAAVEHDVQITFSDEGLERRRKELLMSKGNATDGRHDGREGFDDRRPDRRSVDDAGREAGEEGAAGEFPGRGGRIRKPSRTGLHRGGRGSTASGRSNVTDIGGPGQKPPPQSKNRLRTLSEIDVVRFANRNEVLLPRDVPDYVEQQGTKPDHALRRPLHGMKTGPLIAAERYIAERDEKRAKGISIPRHILYNGQKLEATFQGVRNIDGHVLALLNHGEQIMVTPVDRATARRLSKVSIGESVSVDRTGAIKTMKGRSR